MTAYSSVDVAFTLFLCVWATPLLAEDHSAPPDTVVPASAIATSAIAPFTLAIVIEVNKSTGEITYKWTVLRRFVVTERGTSGAADVRTVHVVPETITANLPLAGFPLYDAKGNRLAVDAFVSRVKRGDVILVYDGGRLPDSRYLRVFKDDTLILVRGNADTPPISADPNQPPATYVPNSH